MRIITTILLFLSTLQIEGQIFANGWRNSGESHIRENLIFEESFEGASPWENWLTTQDNLGVDGNTWARQQSSTYAFDGEYSYRTEVRSGCDGYKSSGYRSEIRPDSITDPTDAIQWYGFSILCNDPNDGTDWTGNSLGHFWQWHPENGSGSASLAIYNNYHANSGWSLAINPSGGSGNDSVMDSNIPITANEWHHVVFKIFQGTSNNGYVKVWIDGVLIFNTATNLDFHVDGMYLKVGQNRWGTCASPDCPSGNQAPCDTWVLYYDNIRIGDSNATYNDVAPVFVFPEPS